METNTSLKLAQSRKGNRYSDHSPSAHTFELVSSFPRESVDWPRGKKPFSCGALKVHSLSSRLHSSNHWAPVGNKSEINHIRREHHETLRNKCSKHLRDPEYKQTNSIPYTS